MNILHDWRENKCSVRDKLKYVLTNENTQQDVVIVAGLGSIEAKIKAHSLMLLIGSQVLETLLEHGKMNNEGIKEIKLPDVRPEAVKFVLEYIYTDCFNLQHEDIMDILYVAFKLQLPGLAALCITKLKDELSPANVLRIFEESTKMNIEENPQEIFMQEQFLNLTNDSLCKLLVLDELEMDEMSLFNCIMRWGKAECNRFELEESSENLRYVLKRIVPLIRFTLMPIHEFASIVVPTNLLDDREINDVYTYLATKIHPMGNKTEPPLWILSSSERKLKCLAQGTSSTNSNNSSPNESANDSNQHMKRRRSPNKDKLLQFMKNISGKKTISGLFVDRTHADCSIDVRMIQNIAGVHPGIISLWMPSYSDGVDRWQSFTEGIISNWNNGYLVQIVWGDSRHPLAQLEIFKTLDENQWNDLIKDDGHLNCEWKKQLDAIVPYLQQLQDAGVVVLCDLCQLINWKRYVWRGRPGMNGSVKLYQITHDYMTLKHRLHSLLWSLSFYVESGMTNLEEFWPGNDYVDVVTVRMGYPVQLKMNLYQKLLEVVGDKPISMEYVATVPSPDILALQPRWTWFTTPVDFLETYFNDNAKIKTTFQSLSIVNKENNEFFKTLNSN